MELTGKVFKIMPLESGQGRNGEWKKQQFVVEFESGQFPKRVCFVLWGEKIDQAALVEGDTVKVYFDLESREFNGKWYTDAKAWMVEKPGVTTPGTPIEETAYNPPLETSSPADDLPF